MAEFSWAYLKDLIQAQGGTGTFQFASGSLLTGSSNLSFNTSSNTMFLTGTMIIKGDLKAHTFDVLHTTRVDVQHSGSTAFGNSSDDTHEFTGSVHMDGLNAQALGNAQTITRASTVAANHNAVLYGPISISASLSIATGSKVKIRDFDDV